ncbi:MAG TPA: alpha/beta hydrolase [Chloroflexota bacterium]|nr:alpha/beta hydrolase [Chloroflexota bacterium]
MPQPSALPPFEHRYVTLPDVRLHVAELPAGPRPMVLLHGIGMDWRVWQAMARRFAPAFHLYAVDLRGHGQSDKPERGYSIAHYAADIEDLIDSLGLTDAVVVGSSLGGVIGGAVEIPPDVVSRRILVDPPLTGGPLRDKDMFRDILVLKHGRPPALADYLARRNPEAGRFLAEAMAEMWRESADGVLTEPLSDADHYFDIAPALRQVESPTLLMRAEPDKGGALSAADAERALRLLPAGSSVVFIPGSGHAVHATNPVEFASQVYRFTGADSTTAGAERSA